MKLRYVCPHCGSTITEVRLPKLDEERLGLTRLTAEERQELVVTDRRTGATTIHLLCDDCLAGQAQGPGGTGVIH